MDDAMGDGSVVLASSAGPETQVSGGWDSTVGKAGLGKTGRVINRLVSDNEALKRDIQIERLRAEESRQAARLVEDKMERLVSEFEGRLVEANVTKTLLARKERQVESLQAAVAVERRRALDAQERERVWKEEMDKLRSDTKMQLDEAGMHVALVEGRYNTISFHWRQQGDEVQQAIGAMGQQVAELGDERRLDDERISTLRELCDQQDGNIRELTRQRDAMAEQFESYRREQEQALQAIKATASDREAEQETILAEAREMLDKLKWALSVKEKVPWAE
jgi:chromosome segregation ATPase